MSDYVTLERGSKNFQAYLMGTFSKDRSALPVKTFNSNKKNERITFRLVEKKKVQRPNWFQVLGRLFRLELLGLTLMPVVVTLTLLWNNAIEVNWFLASLSLFVALFFHGAAFSYNDYIDHVRGVDRVGVDSGSRVIQNAWLSAYQVRNISLVLMLLGTLFSLPIFIEKPITFLGVSLGVGIGVLGYSFAGKGFRGRGLGPTLISLCLGPLVTCGVALAVTESISAPIVSLGLYFGFLAALYLQLRHFARIMADDQVQVKTLMSRLGFDRAKVFLMLQLPFVLIFYAILVEFNIWSMSFYWGLVPLAVVTLGLFGQLLQCRSPLSSSLEKLRFSGARLHLVASFILFLLLMPR